MACGMLVPSQGIKPATPAMEGRVLTTGLLGTSPFQLSEPMHTLSIQVLWDWICWCIYPLKLKTIYIGPIYSFSSVQLLSCVRLFHDPMDYTVCGILQTRILAWVAVPFSRGSSQPRNWIRSPVLQADSLPAEPPGKPRNTGVGSLSLPQGIFLTQESNRGPPAL